MSVTRPPDPATQATSALLRRMASELRSIAGGPLLLPAETKVEYEALANEATVRSARFDAEWDGLGTGAWADARRDTLRFLDLPLGARR